MVQKCFLHPFGFSASYIYPATPHILWLPVPAFQAKVSPANATGYALLPMKRPYYEERQVKCTSVTSINQDERILHFSFKLCKENVLA
jgi:hypothetical protein